MEEGNKKRSKKEIKKRENKKIINNNPETDLNLNLKCVIDGCESNKTFPTIKSLASHIRSSHSKQYIPPKQLEKMLMSNKEKVEEIINNSEEVRKVSEQKSKESNMDFNEVMAKIEEVNSKIPANLCKEFPNLCKLGGKVEKLTEDIDELKGNQIKKLVLQVPKQSDPPKVDLSKTESKLERLDNSILDIQSTLNKLADKKENPQTKKTKIVEEVVEEEKLVEKNEESDKIKDKSKEDITSMVEDLVNKAVAEVKIGSDHHKETSADEIVNCPQCKSKILNKIAEQSKKTDNLDPAVMNFMESMGFIKKEEEKGVNNDNAETNNDKITNERGLSGSAKSSTETGNTAGQEAIKSETTGSEQRSESGQGTIKEETISEGTRTSENESEFKEVKASGTGGTGGNGTEKDTGAEPTTKESEPTTRSKEPKRCRLLFRPNK